MISILYISYPLYPCVEFPNHHSEILIWNFQITIRSIGTHFRMDFRWFQMQGLDLILETSK